MDPDPTFFILMDPYTDPKKSYFLMMKETYTYLALCVGNGVQGVAP